MMKLREFTLRALRRMHLHKVFNFSFCIFLGDKPLIIPIINGIGLSHQNTGLDWMSEIIFILHGLKNGAIIDVGANIGQSLLKVKSLIPNIPYVGIEPSPECNFYLHQLIKKNNLNYCTIVPIGLSNKASLEVGCSPCRTNHATHFRSWFMRRNKLYRLSQV